MQREPNLPITNRGMLERLPDPCCCHYCKEGDYMLHCLWASGGIWRFLASFSTGHWPQAFVAQILRSH